MLHLHGRVVLRLAAATSRAQQGPQPSARCTGVPAAVSGSRSGSRETRTSAVPSSACRATTRVGDAGALAEGCAAATVSVECCADRCISTLTRECLRRPFDGAKSRPSHVLAACSTRPRGSETQLQLLQPHVTRIDGAREAAPSCCASAAAAAKGGEALKTARRRRAALHLAPAAPAAAAAKPRREAAASRQPHAGAEGRRRPQHISLGVGDTAGLPCMPSRHCRAAAAPPCSGTRSARARRAAAPRVCSSMQMRCSRAPAPNCGALLRSAPPSSPSSPRLAGPSRAAAVQPTACLSARLELSGNIVPLLRRRGRRSHAAAARAAPARPPLLRRCSQSLLSCSALCCCCAAAARAPRRCRCILRPETHSRACLTFGSCRTAQHAQAKTLPLQLAIACRLCCVNVHLSMLLPVRCTARAAGGEHGDAPRACVAPACSAREAASHAAGRDSRADGPRMARCAAAVAGCECRCLGRGAAAEQRSSGRTSGEVRRRAAAAAAASRSAPRPCLRRRSGGCRSGAPSISTQAAARQRVAPIAHVCTLLHALPVLCLLLPGRLPPSPGRGCVARGRRR
jgi:hypothetical protein